MSISDLDSVIAKLRYVKYGDYVLSDDHNDLVDAVKIIRDILQDMQEKLEAVGPPARPSPFDPESYKPAGGWKLLEDFLSLDLFLKYMRFFDYDRDTYMLGGIVRDSVLYAGPSLELNYPLFMYMPRFYPLIYIAFKAGSDLYTEDITTTEIYAYSCDGSEYVACKIYLLASYTNSRLDLQLRDYVTWELVTLEAGYDGGWRLACVDFQNSKFTIYDEGGSVIRSVSLGRGTSEYPESEVYIYREYANTKNAIAVDWLGFG